MDIRERGKKRREKKTFARKESESKRKKGYEKQKEKIKCKK